MAKPSETFQTALCLCVISGTQNAGFGRASSVVRVAWQAVDPAGGEPAEGGGFHPLRVEAEGGAAVEGCLLCLQQGLQALHQGAVLDATAADVDIFSLWGILCDGIADAAGAVFQQRAQNVVRIFVAAQLRQ